MKTLCLGGSFNPIHHGHLICARAVMEELGYQQVMLIPSAQPPHKSSSVDMAAPEHRLRMCQLAVDQSANFAVDDLEIRRNGPSYTLDTARELKARGWSEIHWLIGADMLNLLPQWHRPPELLKEVHFVIMARPGFTFEWSELPVEFQSLKNSVVETPLIDISSTDIRRRVRAGLPIEFLTPPPVERCILELKLYTTSSIGI